ncbi:hypothetical protein [Streptomyces tagetis]|uniref:Uncharacterized protein n=1 Tax=Streptomyces tagetis TaxID=2820809 RepID=A0A941B7J3_9ACTN|nr:hypothetical protein [Streptomyces sp. RG38]MBQ0827518.1 hypothetical protein [Streptomyces sp. RG38]
MADSRPVPREPNRLTRRRSAAGLARDLLRAEWELSAGSRRGARGPDAGERLWRALRNAWRDLTGRSRRGYDRGGPAPFDAGGDGGEPYGQGGYGQGAGGQPGYGQGGYGQAGAVPHNGGREPGELTRLRSEIDGRRRASHREHEAFEDALMKLVVSSGTWRRRFERSPESMPLVAEYVANAHTRKALRDSAREEAARQAARPAPLGARFVREAREARHDTPATTAPVAERRSAEATSTEQGQRHRTPEPPSFGQERADLLASSPPESLARWAAMTPDPVLSERLRVDALPEGSRLDPVDGTQSYDALAFMAAPPEPSDPSRIDPATTPGNTPTGTPTTDLTRPTPPTPPSPLTPAESLAPSGPPVPVSPEVPHALLSREGLRSAGETRGPREPSAAPRDTAAPTRPVVAGPARSPGGPSR